MKQISFLINTSVNTLDHVKLLLHSLNENLSGKEHEILIFIDSDNEGTKEYLTEQKKNFHDLKIITHNLPKCVGYSRNNNLMVELAKHDIVSYLQSDMVISKNYDVDILSELEDNCILSATRVEPPLHGISEKTITYDFGTDPTEFNLSKFTEYAETIKRDKTIEYFFAPFTFYKNVWIEIGGYDTQFRRSREDSDLLQRFIHKGVKIKQTFKAIVYHFSCVSSRGKNWFDINNVESQRRVDTQRKADAIELNRFIRKWGNFNHGEYKLNKLDTDLIIKGNIASLESFISNIEPYFSRVWVENIDDKNAIIRAYESEHLPANSLLNFSISDWDITKQYHNTVDYNSIYNIGEPSVYSIKIVLDLNTLQHNDTLLSYIHLLSQTLEQYEVGEYESEAWKISIRKFTYTSDNNINCTNPLFPHSLLTIE